MSKNRNINIFACLVQLFPTSWMAPSSLIVFCMLRSIFLKREKRNMSGEGTFFYWDRPTRLHCKSLFPGLSNMRQRSVCIACRHSRECNYTFWAKYFSAALYSLAYGTAAVRVRSFFQLYEGRPKGERVRISDRGALFRTIRSKMLRRPNRLATIKFQRSPLPM